MRTLTALSACLLLAIGCTTESNPIAPGTDKIETGVFTEIASGSVTSAGGTVSVPSGSMHGLRIDIPSGALSTVWSFTISTAEIKSQTYGAVISPLTPLIRIQCGSQYSDLPFTVTVPITLPHGSFAMGFFYDAETGELEGIPAASLSDTSITLVTRHLSGKYLSDGTSGGIQGSKPYIDLLISAISMGELQGMVETGFQTGVDDWDFVNNGSYVAPGGHCSGQSTSAMWYYHAKKLRSSEPSLYGRFDVVNDKVRGDNPRGYRFASVVHVDQEWPKAANWYNAFQPIATGKLGRDSLHYFTFVYAIKVLHRPQYVGIWKPSGEGHAMIVYRAGNNVLCVADPNYPGISTRIITLNANGLFDPYMASATANDPPSSFPYIGYFSRSALINHTGIAARYEQMLNGTIGTIAPNTFPDVTLQYLDKGAWVAVKDTISFDKDTLQLRSVCASCGITYPGNLSSIVVVDDNDNKIGENNTQGVLTIKVGGGSTTINAIVYGTTTASKTSYITFRRIVVNKQQGGMLAYWLRGVINQTDTMHFGAQTDTLLLPGIWQGSTFIIDATKNVLNDEGQTATITGKMSFHFNSDLSMITSFDAYMDVVDKGNKYIVTDMSGRNIPRTVNSVTDLIYEVSGTSTCSSITRMDMKKHLTVLKEWSCDGLSYVRVRIAK